MAFLDLKYDAFGLDINDLSIKITKLSKHGKNFSVASFGKTKIKQGIVESGIIKDEKALADSIRIACRNIKGKKLNTKYVVASLPEEESFLQVIQMPKMSKKELKTAVFFEAENYIPLPINDVYLDFQRIMPINKILDYMDVLVVATPKKIVDSYVSCLKSAGLIPVALEVESQSILTSVVKNEKSEQSLAIIDIGEDATSFIVFCGCSIRLTHSIPVSLAQVSSLTSRKTAEKKILDELVLQIKKYIEYYQDHASREHISAKSGIQKVVLCGGGSLLKGLPEFLTKKLGIQTELANPFINMPQKKITTQDFLPFATALGLAIKGVNLKDG